MPILVLDLLAAALLVLFCVLGLRRGLVLSLCSLLAVVIALYGASLVSRTLTPLAADRLTPVITEKIVQKLEQQDWSDLFSQPDDTQEKSDFQLPAVSDLKEFLRSRGLPEDLSGKLTEKLKELMPQFISREELSRHIGEAVAETLAETILRALIFLVAFLLILLLCFLLSRALDLVARLPVLHFFNHTGGFLFGLIKGLILLFLIGALLRVFFAELAQRILNESIFFRFFVAGAPNIF